MKLILVRHGDPNYKDNCLTPLGHVQAEAVAPKLMALGINAIYSSTYGRAIETAEHTAAKLGMPITQLDFMKEISSGYPGLSEEEKLRYSPWLSAQALAMSGEDLLHYDYSTFFAWQGTRFEESYRRVTQGFDQWIPELGYQREGLYYRCTRKNDDNVVIFAHGGSITCLLSHFTGIPAPFICCYQTLSCTGITILRFKGEAGDRVVPHIITINEATHIDNLSVHDETPQD